MLTEAALRSAPPPFDTRGLHPQESTVWAVAAGPDRWELRAGWTRAACVAAIVRPRMEAGGDRSPGGADRAALPSSATDQVPTSAE